MIEVIRRIKKKNWYSDYYFLWRFVIIIAALCLMLALTSCKERAPWDAFPPYKCCV